jgi:hypothetical protein
MNKKKLNKHHVLSIVIKDFIPLEIYQFLCLVC